MTQRVLVDTDVLIDVSRFVETAIACLEATEKTATIAISVVTQMELIVGCRNNSELQILNRFLEKFEIVKLNDSISDQGVELLRCYRLSHGLLIPDALIAATALTTRASLLTKNQRDYRFIQGLDLSPFPSEMMYRKNDEGNL